MMGEMKQSDVVDRNPVQPATAPAPAPARSFPSPAGKSLLRRYFIYGRTTLALFCIGGTIGAAFFQYLSHSLDRKLGRLYSKSAPHRLERRKHLFVDKSSGDDSGVPIDDDDDNDEYGGGESGSAADRDPLARLKDGAFKLFDRTRQEIRRGKEKVYKLTDTPKMRDDPDILMKMALSHNEAVWKFGIESLATLPHEKWRNDDFWRISQALDRKSIIALSQYPNLDLRFFLPVKKLPGRKTRCGIYRELRSILAEMPLENADAATNYFTERALLGGGVVVDEEETCCYAGDSFLGGDYLEYSEAAKHIAMTPEEKQDLYCLQAFFCHSKLKNNHDLFLKLPILPHLLDLITVDDRENTKRMVAQIVGNVACRPDAVATLVLSGWVGVLLKWRQDEQSPFRLQLAATRALINIRSSFFHSQQRSGSRNSSFFHTQEQRGGNVAGSERTNPDDVKSKRIPCLLDGVYAYDPIQSFFTGDFEADVVFVHGLLGGAAYTWRQSVSCDEAEQESKGEKPQGTCPTFSNCWPKDWLAKDLSNVRMIGVEYSTQLSDWEPVHPYESAEERTLAARAKELLDRLEAADVGRGRPVIWVTHSMGGLLVKEILRLAEKRDEEDYLLANSCGVVFYGTPHKGSPLANLGNNFFYIWFPTIEVQELSYANKDYLDELNKHFGKLVGKGLQSLSFAELKPTLLGDFMSDSISIHIVPPDAANPNFGQFIPVDTDHMGICKPSGRVHCYLYTTTLNFIKDCLEKRKIRSALRRASSAIAADVEAEAADAETYDFDNVLWP